MKTLFTSLLFLFSICPAFAQREYYKWYFGNQAAMDFVPGAPVNLSNNAMTALDNPAVVSDSLGNILFYSNGNQVWNRNHTLMPNGSGLLGALTGGHAATAVRKPGSSNIYYLFTMDGFAGANGLRYNVIDLNLNGGLGDIVAGQKNIVLLNRASEQIVPVIAANGNDVWIVTHPWNSSSFNAYRIDCSGLNTTPVVSTVGSYRGGSNTDNATGQINVSAANNRIVTAIYTGDVVELFDFNNTTGSLSNAIQLTGLSKAWGVEFSPNGSKLYASGWTTQWVAQFDLSTYTQAAIQASKVNLANVTGPGAPYFTAYMQRAPDGKIYLAVYLDPYLAVINNPDASGTACNLVDNGFNLGGKTSSAGLPDKIVVTRSTLNIGIDTSYCGNFTRTLSTGNPNTLWSTGVTAAQITVTTPGIYWASITGTCNSGASDTIVVGQNVAPVINLGNDTILCNGQSLLLNAANVNPTYHWQDNSTNSTFNVSAAGNYAVTVTNTSGCSASDAINVSYLSPPNPFNLGNDTAYCGNFTRVLNTGNANTVWSTGVTAAQITVSSVGTYSATISNTCGTVNDAIIITQNTAPVVNLGNDTTLCTGQNLLLNAGNAGSTYLWQDNSNAATYNVSTAGIYSVTVTNASGCSASDNINVTYTSGPPVVDIGNDTAYCGNFTRTLSTGNPSTIWSTGATAAQITVNSAGTYSASISNGCGTSSDAILLTQNALPVVTLGNDTTLCTGQNLLLNAGNAGSTYLWQDNSNAATFNVSAAGIYSVTVTNASGCSASDNINVTYTSGPPVVDIGNDTAYCGNFTRTLSTGNANTLWSTGTTSAQITITTAGIYSATISNGCGTASDNIAITQNATPVVNLGNNASLCTGQTLLLDATTAGATYLWQDNSTAVTFNVTAAGTYSVTVTNAAGCAAIDSINVSYNTQAPVVNLGADIEQCGNAAIVLNPHIANANYVWSDNTTDSLLNVSVTGTYAVTVSTGCGSASDAVNIQIHADECALLIPTAFSPNNDGVNDKFRAVCRCPVARYGLHVYNRWGELVFETEDVNEGWNGTFREQAQPLSVYVYYIDYFNYCEQKIKKVVGNVTLVK